MKDKATRKPSAVAETGGIVSGDLNHIQEASREVDPGMKVVWTSAGFWAWTP